jgi:hypothetical protein
MMARSLALVFDQFHYAPSSRALSARLLLPWVYDGEACHDTTTQLPTKPNGAPVRET